MLSEVGFEAKLLLKLEISVLCGPLSNLTNNSSNKKNFETSIANIPFAKKHNT